MVKTCVFAQTTVGEKERGQKVKRNLSGFLLPICSVWAESAWRCLLSFGFAIKIASILVMKKQACVLLCLLRWRPSHGCYQTQQKGGKRERVLNQSWNKYSRKMHLFFVHRLVSTLPPPPPPPPSSPPLLNRQTVLRATAGITCQASGALPLFFSFFFANGLICWGMGEGVKGSPNFTGDGFTLLSFISN